MANKPKSEDWNKFEKAVDTLLRTPPKHKERSGDGAPDKKAKPSKAKKPR